jgi:hypothetical protein
MSQSYDLDILVNGHVVTKYVHEGKVYVEGRSGTEYSLRFRNNSNRRVLAVLSVDGLSCMNGEVAKFDDDGYVVDARSSITVPGWRLNNEEVANFKFGGKGKSYAQKSGQPLNVGVIGCAVFEEKACHGWTLTMGPATVIANPRCILRGSDCSGTTITTKWVGNNTSGAEVTITDSNAVYQPGEQQTSGDVFSCCVGTQDTRACSTSNSIQECFDSAPVVQQELGTEFGRRNQHQVQEVAFNREAQPVVVFEIHYDSRAALEARGISLSGRQHIARAFPNDQPGGVGCKPPRGWQGSPCK